MTTRTLGIALLAICALAAAEQQPFAIEEGHWKIESKAVGPDGTPQNSVDDDCIEDGEMTPEKFMEGMQRCTLSDVVSSAKKMSWTMICEPGGDAKMTGTAEFTSSGDSFQGHMTTKFNFMGQEMTGSVQWTGTRTGPC